MALESNNQPLAKRVGLIFLSVWVAFLVGSTLYGSWAEPQAQGQISLYQTDLTLEALNWQPPSSQSEELKASLFGKTPLPDAIDAYEKVKNSVLKASPSVAEQQPPEKLSKSALQTLELLDRLNLRLGILAAANEQPEIALQRWQEVQSATYRSEQHRQNIATADALIRLWQGPANSDLEPILEGNLEGWFQSQSLEQLWRQTDTTDQLIQLTQRQQSQAEAALQRLFVAVGLPILGSIVGLGLLLGWGVKTLKSLNGNRTETPITVPESPATPPTQTSSSRLGIDVPWGFETFWLTMLLWFFAFFAVSLIVPVTLQLILGQSLATSARGQSLIAFGNYSGLVIAGLALLVWMTRSYVTNFFQWLPIDVQKPWKRWGLGGYVAALPLVLLVSVVNQKLLGDQGGGNPLLEIILRTHDIGTWFILLVMVSVLAPVFEEIVFRGFALTSLSRYIPTAGAIAVSAVLFAIAHLNIADFLPLVVLGCILGTVYAQSRNLLSSILLHSLWNGAQLIELLYLSGN